MFLTHLTIYFEVKDKVWSRPCCICGILYFTPYRKNVINSINICRKISTPCWKLWSVAHRGRRKRVFWQSEFGSKFTIASLLHVCLTMALYTIYYEFSLLHIFSLVIQPWMSAYIQKTDGVYMYVFVLPHLGLKKQ